MDNIVAEASDQMSPALDFGLPKTAQCLFDGRHVNYFPSGSNIHFKILISITDITSCIIHSKALMLDIPMMLKVRYKLRGTMTGDINTLMV